MAKQIKAIKCPHCGSVNKTKLDKDLYHCENCNTDYFLDNDDINININNNIKQENKITDFLNSGQNKIYIIVLSCIVGLIIVLMIINSIMSKPAPRQYGTYSGSSPTTNITTTTPPKPTTPPKIENKPIKYSESYKVNYSYITDNNQVYSFSILYRAYDKKQNELNGFYYEIRDVSTGKIVQSKLLQKNKNDDNWYFRRFDNQTAYIVYNDSTVYAFNEKNLTISDVTQALFKDRSEFVSGVATVNLTPWGYEDSFYILTNNGQEYFFYPLLNKIYNYKSDYDELRKYASELDDKREKVADTYIRTSYVFEKLDGGNSSPTLIKVAYETKNISRFDSFGISSVSNGDKPYKINLQYKEGPVIEDKILAKDRIFFSPTVVYGTKDKLIIRVKNNAAPNAYYNLQSLDPNSGEVKWTVKGNEKLDFHSSSSSDGSLLLWSKYNLGFRKIFLPYGDNYIVQLDYNQYLSISANGEVGDIVTYEPEVIFEKDIQ